MEDITPAFYSVFLCGGYHSEEIYAAIQANWGKNS
jgi:hypothetical protein